jgi:hypothetical protein
MLVVRVLIRLSLRFIHSRKAPVASRLLNRRALRDEHAATIPSANIDDIDTDDEDGDGDKVVKVKKVRAKKAATKVAGPKTPAKPRARKRAPKVAPILFAHWAVCDGGLKRLALFDYKDRSGAEIKLTSMQEQRKGQLVLQLVKEPRVEETPVGVPM